jgi:hypothetical protein
MIGPHEVIYSCQFSAVAGFTYYALRLYRPRSSQARAVVASWRADPHFPRQIYTRDFLTFTLRHQRRATLHERHVAAQIWLRYVQWQRAPAKIAA